MSRRILPVDYFNDRDGMGGKSLKYAQIINEIKEQLRIEKPETMNVVNKILANLTSPNASYGLLAGEIQAGKTPAEMFLAWTWSRCPEHQGHIAFVTKKLDAIRRDIMGKFESNLINKHIINVCARHEINSADALYHFGLTYRTYEKLITKKTLTKKKIANFGIAGQVQIMLMESHNYEHICNWYNTISRYARPAPILVIIDEMHEMYAGANEIVENSGVTSSRKNIGMLHWFEMKSKERRCYLIGVTATPYAPMSADPICWPKHVYSLTPEAPAPGLEYYGYVNHELSSNINIDCYNDTTVVDLNTIEEIINRPRNMLVNGNIEIPFICISTSCLKDTHQEISEIILNTYQDYVKVLIFNSDNKIPLKEWFESLSLSLTRNICERGAIIIIGRNCMAAGITIKPSKPVIFSLGGITYELSGITDQMMPNNDINVTSNKQLMRLLGWHMKGHQSTLWVASDDLIDVYRKEIGDVTRQFIEKYDAVIGPRSVKEIELTSNHIKSFYSKNPYSKRESGTRVLSNVMPLNKPVLRATWERVIDLPRVRSLEGISDSDDLDVGLDLNRTIHSFYNNKFDQAQLRTLLGFVDRARYQIGYSHDRYNQIIEAAIKPKQGNDWQVNGFLYGPIGNKSMLKDCWVVNFSLEYDDVDRDISGEATFQTPDEKWHYFKESKTMEHQSLEDFESFELSANHYRIMKELDIIIEESERGVTLSPNSLFRKCLKIVNRPYCSETYKTHKERFVSLNGFNCNYLEKLRLGETILQNQLNVQGPIRITLRPRPLQPLKPLPI